MKQLLFLLIIFLCSNVRWTITSKIGFIKIIHVKCLDRLYEVKTKRDFEDVACFRIDDQDTSYTSTTITIPQDRSLEFLHLCEEFDGKSSSRRYRRSLRRKRFTDFFKSIFFIPGTKWCGWGNTASQYEDLGEYNITDSCCRDHDHCPVTIKGWESKYGLTNLSPITKSSCECEDDFYQCLWTAAASEPESAISTGNIYFNMLDMDCLLPVGETKKCVQWGWWFGNYCEEFSETEIETKYEFAGNNLTFPTNTSIF